MEPDNVVPLKPEIPEPAGIHPIEQALAVVHQWRQILNARLLALLALLGAMGVFGYAMLDPSPQRLWLSSLYAAGVLWPSIALYVKKG